MGSLEALAWEAHRRGTTYGKLAAGLAPGELDDICDRYCEVMNRRTRQKKKRNSPEHVVIVKHAKRHEERAEKGREK